MPVLLVLFLVLGGCAIAPQSGGAPALDRKLGPKIEVTELSIQGHEFIGVIRNTGDSAANSVVLTYQARDASGSLIGVGDFQAVKFLAPGQESSFNWNLGGNYAAVEKVNIVSIQFR